MVFGSWAFHCRIALGAVQGEIRPRRVDSMLETSRKLGKDRNLHILSGNNEGARNYVDGSQVCATRCSIAKSFNQSSMAHIWGVS